MRSLLALLFLAPVAVAQTAEEKKAALRFIDSLRDDDTGAYRVAPYAPLSLRACNGAVKAIRVLGGKLADKDKVSKFVLGCYDEKAGTFADPGTKADVASTAIGVIVACELGIPKDKFKAAMDYLGKTAKEFEEVRIGAAAVEAWGVKDCPFKLIRWEKALVDYEISIVDAQFGVGSKAQNDNFAREVGSVTAAFLRLNLELIGDPNKTGKGLGEWQLPDGGWGSRKAKSADIETTYRVMRALMLLKTLPKDEKKLREFLAAHRNKEGGYATEPGKASSMSGVYYTAIIAKWLDDMAKK